MRRRNKSRRVAEGDAGRVVTTAARRKVRVTVEMDDGRRATVNLDVAATLRLSIRLRDLASSVWGVGRFKENLPTALSQRTGMKAGLKVQP